MSKVFNQIQEIEEKAVQIIKDAKKAAAHTLSQAKAEGEGLIQKKIDQAKNEKENILKKAEEEAKKEAESININTSKEIEELKTKSKNKISEAKKLIK